jgi:hypothetical protein
MAQITASTDIDAFPRTANDAAARTETEWVAAGGGGGFSTGGNGGSGADGTAIIVWYF